MNEFEKTRRRILLLNKARKNMGYWVNSETGVKTYFTLLEHAIESGNDYIYNKSSFSNNSYEIKLAPGVTTLANGCFKDSLFLNTIILPDSVTHGGTNLFTGCLNLTNLYVYALTPPQINSFGYDIGHEGTRIFVPINSLTAYQSAPTWGMFSAIMIGI